MVWAGKTIAVILGSIMAILILKEWVLLPIGIIVVLYIIRWVADLFWSGRDRGQW